MKSSMVVLFDSQIPVGTYNSLTFRLAPPTTVRSLVAIPQSLPASAAAVRYHTRPMAPDTSVASGQKFSVEEATVEELRQFEERKNRSIRSIRSILPPQQMMPKFEMSTYTPREQLRSQLQWEVQPPSPAAQPQHRCGNGGPDFLDSDTLMNLKEVSLVQATRATEVTSKVDDFDPICTSIESWLSKE
jgi:hypothetical protein